MPAAVFLIQALVVASVVMGGIFLIASLRDQMHKSSASPTPSPVQQMASSDNANPSRHFQQSEPPAVEAVDQTDLDYKVLEQTQPLYARPPSAEAKQAYRGWLGAGWELVGMAGQIGPAGALSAGPGESALLFFAQPQGVSVRTLSWGMSRLGGHPASVHVLLGSRGQPPELSVISNFQAGHYLFALLASGQPQFLDAPRHPTEESMNVHVTLAGGNASLSVDGITKTLELPVAMRPINSVQVILVPSTKTQNVEISSLSVQNF